MDLQYSITFIFELSDCLKFVFKKKLSFGGELDVTNKWKVNAIVQDECLMLETKD